MMEVTRLKGSEDWLDDQKHDRDDERTPEKRLSLVKVVANQWIVQTTIMIIKSCEQLYGVYQS